MFNIIFILHGKVIVYFPIRGNRCPKTSIYICSIHWIISTVGEHVGAGKPLPSAYVPIGIDKASCFRIVIAGVEIVKTRFGVVVIAAISERIKRSNVSGVGVGNCVSAAVRDAG